MREERLVRIGRILEQRPGERLTLWERAVDVVDDMDDGRAPGLDPREDCFSCSFASTKAWNSSRAGRWACTLIARLAMGERMALDGEIVSTARALIMLIDYRATASADDACPAHDLASEEVLQERAAHLFTPEERRRQQDDERLALERIALERATAQKTGPRRLTKKEKKG